MRMDHLEQLPLFRRAAIDFYQQMIRVEIENIPSQKPRFLIHEDTGIQIPVPSNFPTS